MQIPRKKREHQSPTEKIRKDLAAQEQNNPNLKAAQAQSICAALSFMDSSMTSIFFCEKDAEIFSER